VQWTVAAEAFMNKPGRDTTGENPMTQRIIEINSPNFVAESQLGSPDDLSRVFDIDRPLALEIGCGIGDFVVQLAAQKPHMNFLAIDIYNKGCYKTCRKIDQAGLMNVRVMRIEARYLLARYLTPESLTAIYINCPDPWPKKRHRQRRLVTRDFLQTVLHYLKPGGDLYFTTDFADYARQVAQIPPTLDGYRNRLSSDWETVPPDYPQSKYMRRFLDRNQPIYFIHCSKKQGISLDPNQIPTIRPGFRTPWSNADHVR
jgi:tRNA (guanine-N7-)-methyltransferase